MTKKQRQEVFEKYGGKCAYTGKPLGDDWQVDHVLCRMESYITQKNHDCTDNMLPALRIVNHYKRGLFLTNGANA